ncbi:transglutaminase domain-containing protein [Leptothoe sp. PORK10 BA2]|uniref:transglutaminase domain-containing protein n=1 Tax=Leptothoe sp. PORK10 BA2 TaxID=3110254 RepID=UPI002B21A92A|nr:transglutaminase domain-containing protein [Leptothoe sp. PORK10 BA2]MEA5463608.1 transglutaminase domain-containing protein [Leptothoe sp. PORK10 BA2]
MSTPEHGFPKQPSQPSTIRPIGVYALSGLAADGKHLFSIDTLRGYLVAVDPGTNNTVILNPHQLEDKEWINAVGLSLWQDTFWFARDQEVFWCDRDTLKTTLFTRLPYPIAGVAVWENTVYVSCQKSGYIHRFDRSTGEPLGKFPQPGVGPETLATNEDGLWVCDQAEQTVYCLDRTTGNIQLSTLTPHSSPTGIAFYQADPDQAAICYIVYAYEEPYIRDNPNNAESPHELTFRDLTFIHPLYLHPNPTEQYTLSNGYLVEMSYVEELVPLEAVTLNNVEWRMALPANTLRQRVRQVEPIGHPFTIEEQNGQQVAVFQFDQIQPFQGGLFGWKALVEMYSIKYYLTPDDVDGEQTLPTELQHYLIDDDELDMDKAAIQQAAREGAGTETNGLRKMLRIRNYVYDRLSYGIQPTIDTPEVALVRGTGSCGEYVGLLLALARLNGIACRTIGRYKCPPHPEFRHLPLEPDFNHVWLEFYIPGIGWLPMESNVDDVIERGPYPQRFFMGLSWYHMEIGKEIPFAKMRADDKPDNFSMRDLAINHIRFRILDELNPAKTTVNPE